MVTLSLEILGVCVFGLNVVHVGSVTWYELQLDALHGQLRVVVVLHVPCAEAHTWLEVSALHAMLG